MLFIEYVNWVAKTLMIWRMFLAVTSFLRSIYTVTVCLIYGSGQIGNVRFVVTAEVDAEPSKPIFTGERAAVRVMSGLTDQCSRLSLGGR